jgi:hypothetical protein
MNYISFRGSLAVGLAIGLLYLGWAYPALSHTAKPTASQPLGWQYGWECCNLMDCREVSESVIEETPQGYVYKVTGEVIPYGDKKIKESKDEFYHLCTHGGKDDAKIICLYTPNRGF